MLSPRWEYCDVDERAVRTLADALGTPPMIARLLVQRGVDTPAAASEFLEPSLHQLSDPLTLTDMEAAAARLDAARAANERVLVFGDYDVDGIAGTALLVRALRGYGIAKCHPGLPKRLEEGYGLAPEHVQAAAAEGVQLIVTVDNGITAHAAAAEARTAGIDLIITDHHLLNGALPDALAVVNPRREAGTHPAQGLCGAAVAAKLAQALTGALPALDLVALATVADIVPLTGENRVLTALGLEKLASEPAPGLKKLAQKAGLGGRLLRAEDLAFQLAPRLNAAGRLADGEASLGLLLAESEAEAAQPAQLLCEVNDERREIERAIYEQAVEAVESNGDAAGKAICLADPGWHPGVIGIVASRIMRRYHRPAVLVAIDADGVGRGSGRSIPEFDLGAALAACSEHLDKYGGHPAAGGFTLDAERFAAFQSQFRAYADANLDDNAGPALRIDAVAPLSMMDGAFVRQLEQLEPCGHGNRTPVFGTHNVEIVPGSVRLLRGGHVRLSVQADASVMDVIAFRMEDTIDAAWEGCRVDIAYSPRLNTWRGVTRVDLLLRAIKRA